MKFNILTLGYIALASTASLVCGDYVWSETKDDYGGLIKIEAHDLKYCQAECLYLEYCNVIAYDNSTDQCFIQMDSDIKPVPKDENGSLKTYEFNRDAFLKGETCWKKIPGKRIKGTTPTPFDPLAPCMKYCVACQICDSLTYDAATTPSCWLQLAREASVVDEGSFESSPSATSYLLDIECFFNIMFLAK